MQQTSESPRSAVSARRDPQPSGRLVSLDALRGFDMTWIIGGDVLVHLLAGLTGWAGLIALSGQMRHAEWSGLNAYDLIFPLFMFLSGVSLTLSLRRHNVVAPGDSQRFLIKTVQRLAVLILLGILYNFGWDVSADRFRVASVLGQIGIAYFLTALAWVYLPGWTGRLMAVSGVLSATAVLQLVVPVPGGVAGLLTPDGSINAWIDQTFLPGRLYGGSYDPEGILNSFSASAVTMLGACVGGLIKPTRPVRSLARLIAVGILLAGLGYALSGIYPVIKAAWTVSFSLVSAGISALLLALFFWLFDVLNLSRLARLFSVIGMNSIAIYMLARFLAYPAFVYATDMAVAAPVLSIAIVTTIMIAEWLALYYCYRRGWFLKI